MAARTPDIEEVKRAFVERLKGPGFLEKLAAIDDEKDAVGDERTPGPADVKPYEVAKPSVFPLAEVVGISVEYSEVRNHDKTAGDGILIAWTVVGDNEDVMTRQLERLTRATVDVFDGQYFAENGSGPLVADREDYAELAPTNPKAGIASPFVKGSQVLFTVVTRRL